MPCRGIRGATTVETNSREAILAATAELIREMVSANAVEKDDVASAYFTTTPDGKHDILIYHARSYREIKGDALNDPNRHTRAQLIKWRKDGTPDFGEPMADSEPKKAK